MTKKNKIPLIVALSLLCVALVALVITVIVFMNNSNNKQDASVQPPSEETTEYMGITAYEAYDVKIEEYIAATLMSHEEFLNTYTDDSSINTLMVHYYHNYGDMSLFYALYDVDLNGVPELVFSDGSTIIDIYTLDGESLVKLYENCYFGERSRLHILTDGRLLNEGSNGAGSSSCSLDQLDEDGTSIVKKAGYCYDYDGYNSYDVYYTPLTPEQYSSKIEEWLNDSVFDAIEWVEFAHSPSKAEMELAEVRNSLTEHNYAAAVAYLDYADLSYREFKESLYDGLIYDYPYLEDIAIERYVVFSGGETYLVVPKNEDAMVKVSELYLGDEGMVKGNVYYQSQTGEPFVVKGNVSDIMPNFVIEIKNPGEDWVEFSPMISLRDGSVALTGDVMDITIDEYLYSY